MTTPDRSQYSGTYQKRAASVRRQANADPSTVCWRCGLTLDAARAKFGPHVKWYAGLTTRGDARSPLLPEHSACNAAAAATVGHQRRGHTITPTTTPMPRSQRWY